MAREEFPQSKTTVSMAFREGVDREALHSALDALLDRLGEHTGCAPCGLNGFDIVLHQGDPVEIQAHLGEVVRAVDAVIDVSVAPGRATAI